MGRLGVTLAGQPLLLCASDAGGARVLAPIAAELSAHQRLILTTPAGRSIFSEENLDSIEAPAEENELAKLIQTTSPNAILVATARPDSAERRLTHLARLLDIPCVAVLDEWYDYVSRFALNGEKFGALPDLICCPDQQAVTEAAKEGLPAERLVNTGSPALARLAERIRKMQLAPPPRPSHWPNDRKICLFVSETHEADYGRAHGEIGPLGPFIGYTETHVRSELALSVANCSDLLLIERPHPSASLPLNPPAEHAGNWWIDVDGSLWPLLWHADFIIGMRSMALLEAAMMGHRPLSFQPGLIGPNRCTAGRLGLADSAWNRDDLVVWLSRPPQRTQAPVPAFADPCAAANVISTLSRLLEGRRQ